MYLILDMDKNINFQIPKVLGQNMTKEAMCAIFSKEFMVWFNPIICCTKQMLKHVLGGNCFLIQHIQHMMEAYRLVRGLPIVRTFRSLRTRSFDNYFENIEFSNILYQEVSLSNQGFRLWFTVSAFYISYFTISSKISTAQYYNNIIYFLFPFFLHNKLYRNK